MKAVWYQKNTAFFPLFAPTDFNKKDVNSDTPRSEILACLQHRAGFSSLYLGKHLLRDTEHVFVDFVSFLMYAYLYIPIHSLCVVGERLNFTFLLGGFLFI